MRISFPLYSGKKILSSAVIISMFVLVSGCAEFYSSTVESTDNNEAYLISGRQETAIGRAISNRIIKDNKLIKNKTELSYVRSIGKKIIEAYGRNYPDYHFYIIDNNGMNAFALPGGFIFLSEGIVKKTDKDELAFVLGHEIGHIYARHPIKCLESSLGVNKVLELAVKNPDKDLLDKAVDIIYNSISLGYSQDNELEADSLAAQYAYKAGYDPRAGIRLMKKLKKDEGNSYTEIFLRSHPDIEERINNINKQINKLKNND